MKPELQQYIKKVSECINAELDRLLPIESCYPESIHKLMRYSMFAGGKRIRPCLLMSSFQACNGTFGDPNTLLVSAAIEMLHTFSLIHDDLPCMDDDDFRRGKPTAHKAFNEGLAVLGGDALCIYAFEILARTKNIEIISEIASALGTFGMIGGQVVDIESESKQVDRKTVEYIHTNKTAAFIRASVRCGALLAHADSETLQKLSLYGSHVGLAFQVIDDIMDEESTTEQMGKPQGSDRKKGKATFPGVCGIKESKRYATELIDAAYNTISFLGTKGIILHQLAEFIGTRMS